MAKQFVKRYAQFTDTNVCVCLTWSSWLINGDEKHETEIELIYTYTHTRNESDTGGERERRIHISTGATENKIVNILQKQKQQRKKMVFTSENWSTGLKTFTAHISYTRSIVVDAYNFQVENFFPLEFQVSNEKRKMFFFVFIFFSSFV